MSFLELITKTKAIMVSLGTKENGAGGSAEASRGKWRLFNYQRGSYNPAVIVRLKRLSQL